MPDRATRTALVAGATGLIGGHLVRRLLSHADYARVHVLTRHALSISDPKIIQHRVDFERLATSFNEPADDTFCCLGTTLRQAGSREAFRRVDHDYPLALANLARLAGARVFLMVSALGADAHSRVFYNRIKGETERDIAALGLSRVVFLRPSLLLGERREFRAGEKAGAVVGRLIAPVLVGRLRRYRPIEADDVAAAMLYLATHDSLAGPVESDAIAQLARQDSGAR